MDGRTIEEYLELEKKIASAETYSPALILQQKKDQLVFLRSASTPLSTLNVRVTWRRGSSSRREVVRLFRIRRRLCIMVYHLQSKFFTLFCFIISIAECQVISLGLIIFQ